MRTATLATLGLAVSMLGSGCALDTTDHGASTEALEICGEESCEACGLCAEEPAPAEDVADGSESEPFLTYRYVFLRDLESSDPRDDDPAAPVLCTEECDDEHCPSGTCDSALGRCQELSVQELIAECADSITEEWIARELGWVGGPLTSCELTPDEWATLLEAPTPYIVVSTHDDDPTGGTTCSPSSR